MGVGAAEYDEAYVNKLEIATDREGQEVERAIKESVRQERAF